MRVYIDRAMPEIGKHVSQIVLHPLHEHDTKILTDLADNYALLGHGRHSRTKEVTHVCLLLTTDQTQVADVVALMNQLTEKQRKAVMNAYCACCGKSISKQGHRCERV